MYRETTDAQNELAATNRMAEIIADGPARRAAKKAELLARLEKMGR